MGRFGAAGVLVLLGVMSVLAAEMPTRKPGLWEIAGNFANRNGPGQVIQTCVDTSTDQIMQSGFVAYGQSTCSKRDVQNQRMGSRSTPPARSAERQ
jgi:hypothetical protein